MTELLRDRVILATIIAGVCICVAVLAGKTTNINIKVDLSR